MKRITKACEPKKFSAWKKADRMAHRPRWRRVPTSIKEIIHESLLREQGFICCYCEASVVTSTSHVEHFRPKNKFHASKLDYNNLHCSCQKGHAVSPELRRTHYADYRRLNVTAIPYRGFRVTLAMVSIG